ncbi:MAG: trypsin-like peptidase domain-containing protein [Oscillospiraceae bacterium]|nr:trypsin-like peptidase domain-containing protein [Oscillospiraceae bacterium]
MNYDYDRYDPAFDRAEPSRGAGKRRPFRLFVLCLVCVLIAGAVGLGAGLSVNGWRGAAFVKKPDTASLSAASDTALTRDGARADRTLLPADGDGLSASEIYAANVEACVGVTTEITTTNIFGQTTSGAISGSGFIVSRDGYIVTNYHVIETAALNGYKVSVVMYDGSRYDAEIICGEEKNDVAMLKIDASDLPSVTIGDFDSVRVGETVYTIGNPLGELTQTMTKGIVSALERNISVEPNTVITMFQTDAAINSGNSGGPVFNSRGEVIGIVSAKYSKIGVEGLGFAIPIDDAMKILEDLRQYGYVRGRPLLGVTVANADIYVSPDIFGAYVDSVEEGSCAEAAGIRKGDVIVGFGGVVIRSKDELILVKDRYEAGDTVAVTVLRAGKTVELTVTLDEAGSAAYLNREPDEEEERGYESFGN